MRKRITLEGFVAKKGIKQPIFTAAVFVALFAGIYFLYFDDKRDNTLKQIFAEFDQIIKRIIG
jgi:Na+/H+-dicarboxylate symporter